MSEATKDKPEPETLFSPSDDERMQRPYVDVPEAIAVRECLLMLDTVRARARGDSARERTAKAPCLPWGPRAKRRGDAVQSWSPCVNREDASLCILAWFQHRAGRALDHGSLLCNIALAIVHVTAVRVE